jgi:hypothetical protein
VSFSAIDLKCLGVGGWLSVEGCTFRAVGPDASRRNLERQGRMDGPDMV